jgi:hypothetical protein
MPSIRIEIPDQFTLEKDEETGKDEPVPSKWRDSMKVYLNDQLMTGVASFFLAICENYKWPIFKLNGVKVADIPEILKG